AEDGIRDFHVTGVQTCALPIYLSGEHLRAYLKRLPDFEDIGAEERAMAHAMAYPSLLHALQFFLDWPALDRAAELLEARHDEIRSEERRVGNECGRRQRRSP